jgi:chromosome partitioning protein
MHIIGVLNTKGGAGKTTLTTCLAVRAAKEAKVAVVDLDPQSSYSDWNRRRGEPENPELLRGEDRASDAVEKLMLTSDYDYVFMDGPPAALLVTEDAINVSTLVVIPVRASRLDLSASRDCIQICQDSGTPFLVVVNAKTRGDNSLVEQTRELLFSWKTPIANTVISHRMQYINAITTGKTGPEKDKLAAAEIDKLWAEIKVAVRKAAKAKAKARAA